MPSQKKPAHPELGIPLLVLMHEMSTLRHLLRPNPNSYPMSSRVSLNQGMAMGRSYRFRPSEPTEALSEFQEIGSVLVWADQ